jgi:diguanylate cyclase (GGDEF)-like protein/PAS domain S-box-containing protein
MTSPLYDDSRAKPGPVRSAADNARSRVKVARKWAYLISETAYVPLSPAEIDQAMYELTDQVFGAALSDPFTPELVGGIGARLVEMRCMGPMSLRRTMDVLGKALLSEPELQHLDRREERVVQVLGAVASDYLEASRRFVFDQQENLKQALLRATSEAQRHVRSTDARFDALFTSSPTGVAMLDLDGNFLRTNDALDILLDRESGEFAELTLYDVVNPDEVPFLRAACQDLLDGWLERLRQQRRLVRSDGETVRAALTVSLLSDADGQPERLLVTVHDESEISLLQGQLSHQSLHDVLTGLPNRQYFTTRLESVLRQADPATGATLYHLDLDAFSMITDGLGRHTGDRVLMNVAQRLKAVVAGEKAMVARFDGDEFAIVVENSDTTPDVVSTIARINDELAEPLYIEGHGVAASASIGVVHRPPRDADVTELLRTADMTLRRAKVNGRRQWGLFDRDADARDRECFSLTAQMPGALELGAITAVCRPMISLADNTIAGFEGVLNWEHQDSGLIPHERCMAMGEQTGLSLPLRDTLLAETCAQVRQWNEEHGTELPLAVDLSSNQSCDPDLVGAVLTTLDKTGLPRHLLRLAMPAEMLLADRGESVDNLNTLADNGISMAVHGFGSAAGDLELLEDLPIRTAGIARRLVDRQRTGSSPLLDRTLTDLISVAHLAGAAVTVSGMETADQAAWWHTAGADLALGPHYPAPW